MEPHHYLLAALGVFGFLTNILVLAITGTRALGRVETAILDRIAKVKEEIDEELASDRRIAAEAFAAVRHKMHEIELYSERTFVRRDSYHAAMQRVTSEMASVQQANQAQRDSMELKFEKFVASCLAGRATHDG